jgi:hypothetical protein
LEKLARDKHSSLLQKCVNYGHQGLDNIGTLTEFSTLGMGMCLLHHVLGNEIDTKPQTPTNFANF